MNAQKDNLVSTDSTKSKEEEIGESIASIKKRKEHLLQQIRTFNFTWYGWLIASTFGAAFIYIMKLPLSSEDYEPSKILINFILGAFGGNFIYAYL
ncbi:hypothetical protein OC25_17775 [Pedobacter kyungheensis]|uniref:Uncharacterized protein n=1 Tax=Pedobacter kyungheensis TaxID=1069985 RepID=A0A0C1D5I4_9SPHI|nr:hypothetical protein [Pedobacter kyungheensis]KIA92281.1 hypothetical protein OC25_17775 [Pedobacter kyungheensis]